MKRKTHVLLAGLLYAWASSAVAAGMDPLEEQDPGPQAGLYEIIRARLHGVDLGRSSEAPIQPELLRVHVERAPGDSQDQGRAFFIPPGSRSFLPDYMTTAAPGSLLSKDAAMTREVAQRLADYFRRFYPDVVYHVDWDNETVNAYAWKEGNTRHVALMGGLMRHKAIQSEGLGLVLAHELGHHYGGEPTYPSGLSCEGQADYWGASVGMRTAWGDQYRDQILAAIDQMDAFFTRGLVRQLSEDQELERLAATGSCGHPPAACRKQTYQAAMEGRPKPECAGPTVPAGVSMLPGGVSAG